MHYFTAIKPRIVGKAINGHKEYSFAVAILNNEQGAIYVDALLIGEDAVSQLFGFSYAYFMVSHPVPSAIIYFLQGLMPRRKKEGLYSSIGFQKQGKTDFYRGFLHHLDCSDDDLILAPGIPGMVMLPLNLELELAEKNENYERIDCLVKSFGNAIKELSAANIFPGDLLYKNFGVTRLGRVVFYDYDEIVYLTDCNFRKKPQPRNHQELMSATPWYSVAPNDIFPEEFASFLLGNALVKEAFMKHHADLFDADSWIKKQENINNGIYEDVFPYPRKFRLKRD